MFVLSRKSINGTFTIVWVPGTQTIANVLTLILSNIKTIIFVGEMMVFVFFLIKLVFSCFSDAGSQVTEGEGASVVCWVSASFSGQLLTILSCFGSSQVNHSLIYFFEQYIGKLRMITTFENEYSIYNVIILFLIIYDYTETRSLYYPIFLKEG